MGGRGGWRARPGRAVIGEQASRQAASGAGRQARSMQRGAVRPPPPHTLSPSPACPPQTLRPAPAPPLRRPRRPRPPRRRCCAARGGCLSGSPRARACQPWGVLGAWRAGGWAGGVAGREQACRALSPAAPAPRPHHNPPSPPGEADALHQILVIQKLLQNLLQRRRRQGARVAGGRGAACGGAWRGVQQQEQQPQQQRAAPGGVRARTHSRPPPPTPTPRPTPPP